MKIVVSLGSGGNLREKIERALKEGADLVEVRVDLIWGRPPPIEEVSSLIYGLNGRVVLTVRSRAQGGAADAQDREWIERASEICCYVDVEYENSGVRVSNAIYSWHDPSGTPNSEELVRIAERMLRLGGIAKLVTLARDELEAYRLLSLYRKLDHGGRLVAFCMGEKASFSRRLSALLGSPLVYCYLDSPTAEGQLSLREALLLRELLC